MKDDKTALKISLLEEMPCAVLFVNGDGVIEYANDEACALLRKERRALLGRVCSDALGGGTDSGLSRLMDGAVREGRAFLKRRAPYRFDCGDGELYVTASPHSEGGVIFILEEASASSAKDSAMVYINELNRQLESRNKLIAETFGRFLSDDVVKDLLEDPQKANLGGKKCLITILMSDLRGFTAMSEKMKPSDIVDMLNYYFGVMLECITRNNGNVIEFLGDGIFVVFGAPIASENHAAEAVAAAVEMERAMADVNKWNVERGYPELSMGIGINTGSAVVGNIGCEKRTKYGVLGSNVNLTGRIESYTVAGQILISPTTREQIAEELIIEQEADVSPKGVDGVLHLTQVIGIGGDYNVSYEIVHKPLFGLDMPHVITYRSLEGKHVSDESYLGKILAVSEEQVLLESPHDLEVFDNIRMDLAGETYGKVIKKTEGGYLIDFTALPESFKIWFDAITQGSRD